MNSPIVLIHGLWLTPRSWEGWKARFEERGHEVLTPAWPHMEGEVEALRRDPSVMNGLGGTADDQPALYDGSYHTAEYWTPMVAFTMWLLALLQKG